MTANRPQAATGAIRYNNGTGEFEVNIGTGISGIGGGGGGMGVLGQIPAVTGGGSNWVSTAQTYTGHPMFDQDSHQFNCQKVENGWTVQYRGKTFIATSLDEMMDQMKAAMVTERIEK